jgi:hypothetical protein
MNRPPLNRSQRHSNRLSQWPRVQDLAEYPYCAGKKKDNSSPKSCFIERHIKSNRLARVRYGLLTKKLPSLRTGLLPGVVKWPMSERGTLLAQFLLHLTHKHIVTMLAFSSYYAKRIKQRCITAGAKSLG